ncbi:MAG: polyprenol monophosphomannose synthase [Candidatus Marinimicrobia bacterium]|jgi:dolichol-phosphate mannosyltransferase|nr:polyprenol monophosphomannose synthase [Candidatus Neomarinimicrobiota bacterium]
MKRLVIIPTYNEKANIEKLINDIQLLDIENLDILIIDDNSPDGTGEIIKNLQKENDNIFIIERESKLGLGTAYIRGFKYALGNNYDQIAQMDADYSHDPKDLIKLFKAVEKYDWAIGSRYKSGINVVNWPLSRLILSYGANIYSRIITGMKIKDGTAGFKCWNKNVLAKIKLDEVKSHGYSFQIEMNFRAWKAGFKFFEVPIVFTDRTLGESKMSKKIVHEAIFMVWKLKYWSITKKI